VTPSVTSVESSEQFWRIFANPGVVLLFAAKRVCGALYRDVNPLYGMTPA